VLRSPTAPQPGRLADLFIGELDELPGEVLFVLDDYHAVTDRAIHSFMTAVIQNAPAGVHFVLLVRADPSLKLARLRASQQVLEIRAAQLRFTQDETQELVGRIVGDLATEETIALLAARTEGWAAGIHLASISLRDSGDTAAFAVDFARGSSQPIIEYLVGEVLENLSEQERAMLLRTAILPRFCASLFDAIRPQPGYIYTGEAFLERLRSMNLFLVALDEEGFWYRFHHLFADILRHHLRLKVDESTITQLHAAASYWFEANHLIDEAITHAMHAGDAERAARLVELNTDTLLNLESWRTLTQLRKLAPSGPRLTQSGPSAAYLRISGSSAWHLLRLHCRLFQAKTFTFAVSLSWRCWTQSRIWADEVRRSNERRSCCANTAVGPIHAHYA
jgi:LuxR family maltose regulon positive regulatory protein